MFKTLFLSTTLLLFSFSLHADYTAEQLQLLKNSIHKTIVKKAKTSNGTDFYISIKDSSNPITKTKNAYKMVEGIRSLEDPYLTKSILIKWSNYATVYAYDCQVTYNEAEYTINNCEYYTNKYTNRKDLFQIDLGSKTDSCHVFPICSVKDDGVLIHSKL